jgi:hypothetical protein
VLKTALAIPFLAQQDDAIRRQSDTGRRLDRRLDKGELRDHGLGAGVPELIRQLIDRVERIRG